MKLHASVPGSANVINAYGEGYVMVNGERRDSSLVVMADRVEAWRPKAFERLGAEDFAFLRQLGVEIVRAVERYAQAPKFADDLTILILRRRALSEGV